MTSGLLLADRELAAVEVVATKVVRILTAKVAKGPQRSQRRRERFYQSLQSFCKAGDVVLNPFASKMSVAC